MRKRGFKRRMRRPFKISSRLCGGGLHSKENSFPHKKCFGRSDLDVAGSKTADLRVGRAVKPYCCRGRSGVVILKCAGPVGARCTDGGEGVLQTGRGLNVDGCIGQGLTDDDEMIVRKTAGG